MTGVEDIFRPAPHRADSTLGAGLTALLRETLELLERLERLEEAGSIDLRSLPFGADDRRRLEELLGAGEVEITLNVDGKSRLRETGYAGVWWVEHRNPQGELVAELLEITTIPEIAVTGAEELTASAARLRQRLVPRPLEEGTP